MWNRIFTADEMKYPGRIIKFGDFDAQVVAEIKRRLNEVLVLSKNPDFRLNAADGLFDRPMKQAVMMFQAQHVDSANRPLKVDGEVGPLTWEALYGSPSITHRDAVSDSYLAMVLTVACAAADARVREKPVNSNSGPEVNKYLASVDKPPGLAWCVAFIYYCFQAAAEQSRRNNVMVKTAGVLDHWNRCVKEKGARRIMAPQAKGDPSLILPGMIFVMDYGGGMGHSGLIEKINGGILTTIEGNTDASHQREGGGVYRLTRKTADINKGYIYYGDS